MSDGIRKNVAKITQAERDKLRDAILQVDMSKFYPDSVSYWDKQDAIHQATHVHGGPAFLPWHRELCNRFEALLREVDPTVSLHYWDWTTDPRASDDGAGGTINLFTNIFMGSSVGRAGAPLDTLDNNGVFAGSRDATGNPADPPQEITRTIGAGAPAVASDATIITTGDGSPNPNQYQLMRGALEGAHNTVHGYIGGTIGDGHSAFEDPFVFLLHSNVDRLWAMWQTAPGKAWRLDPDQVYGVESSTTGGTGILTDMEPWAGGSGLRPWAPPDNQQYVKNSKHPTVVAPPCYDTLPISVTLDTLAIAFQDVPAGETTARAAVFSISACMPLTFEIIAGPGAGFGTPLGTSVTVTPPMTMATQGRVWISYTGSNPGDSASGSVTIRCVETGEEWTILITANTIQRPTVASVLVLDQSGSMDDSSGIPGNRRIDILKSSAPNFVELMPDDDALGIVSFDHDPHPVMPITLAGVPVFGAGRTTAKAAINAHATNLAGATAIGDGVELGHNSLALVAGFDHKAMVVFTDGHETSSKYIADIAGLITERVYAIGLGTAEQLNPVALNALTNSSGGYLLMTGALGPDDIFRLSKYYLQILAGVTNADIVLDPDSTLLPKSTHRIPFQVAETDIGNDVILLSPAPWAFTFALETPSGDVIDRTASSGIAGMTFAAGSQVHFYRMRLPVPVGPGAHEGVWYALLSVDEGNFKEYLSSLRNDRRGHRRAQAHGVPYSLSVHTRTNLRMRPGVHQSSQQPGATVLLRAHLTEYGLPVEGRAIVAVEIERPDGTATSLPLAEVEPGVFEGSTSAMMAGIYPLRFRASGRTLRGLPFTREELRTAAVWKGGDSRPPSSQSDPRERDEQLCHLLECLLDKATFSRFFAEHNIDPEAVSHCIRRFCSERLAQPSEASSRRHEMSPRDMRELVELLEQPGSTEVVTRLSEMIRRARV